jgi:2-keto-4-pentenoate hydratase/2-oxohepta-3-ene-1,7-dioic acid hydratase in catechol pathway
MKLACIETDGEEKVVLVLGDELVDLTAHLGVQRQDVLKFLAMGPEAQVLAERCANSANHRLAGNAVRFRAPVSADKVLGVGMNYHSFVAQAREAGMLIPEHRFWFYRARTCIVGPYDDIWLPRSANDLDYEGELAVVIGRRCRYVSVSEAREVLAGFTVANDLTLRQRAKDCVVLGKSFDTHTPIGPCIGTMEEMQDPHQLEVRTWVNGELRQNSSTADMIADCYQLISEISSACTLNPGDIILTGTPDGSGIFHRPPLSLAVGDSVKIEIKGLGIIENRVIEEPAML